MNRAKFFEAANDLSNWESSLFLKTKSSLRQAEDELCRKQERPPGTGSPRALVLMHLSAIGEKLEEVMAARKAADCEARFELAFRLLDAPRLVQWQVRRRLDGLPLE